MYQYDDATAVAGLPAPAAPGAAGYFTDGNPGASLPATILRSDFMNMVMMELLNILTAAGVAPSKTTYNQVLLAIEALIAARASNFAVDTGAANAYVIALAPAPAALVDGMIVSFKANNANNGPSTLDVNGFGAIPLVGQGGALQGGEILATDRYEAIYVLSSNEWGLIGQTGGALSIAPATKSNQAVSLGQILAFASQAIATGTVGTSVTFTAPCKGVVLVFGNGNGYGNDGITGTNVTFSVNAVAWASASGNITIANAMGAVAAGAAVTLTNTIASSIGSVSIFCLFIPSV